MSRSYQAPPPKMRQNKFRCPIDHWQGGPHVQSLFHPDAHCHDCRFCSRPALAQQRLNKSPSILETSPSLSPHNHQPLSYTRAYLEMIVADVDRAADRATQAAYDESGYLAGSQSWTIDGRKATTLVLAVPTINFQDLRRTLLGLGRLVK